MNLKQFEHDFLADFLRQQHIDLFSYGNAALSLRHSEIFRILDMQPHPV